MLALVDCNAFFCSCERLFRPDLWHRPVGVLSNNDGCFVSRTKELKALGVRMGQPFFEVRDLCRKAQVAVFSANFSLYTNISDRVTSLLSTMAPEVEVYSVDEVFLDWSGFPLEKLEQMAREVRLRVWREVGIPVSVGVAPTKVLAKMANEQAKKDESLKGVLILEHREHIDGLMKKTAIGDLWGVGRKSEEKFKRLGIQTAYDLSATDNDRLIQKHFTKLGRAIQDELRGISCFALNGSREPKKQIHCSRSFGQLIFERQQLEQAVAHFVSKAAIKLRAQGSTCQGVSVYFYTSPFRQGPQHQFSEWSYLSAPTLDTRKLIEVAWSLVRKGYQSGFGYYKAGIGLSHLSDHRFSQGDLFVVGDTPEAQDLMMTMDRVNAREGSGTLELMACLKKTDKAQWSMRQELKSPRYVTGWTELPRVS